MEEWYSYITEEHMDRKYNLPYVKLVAFIPIFTFFIPISEEVVSICS